MTLFELTVSALCYEIADENAEGGGETLEPPYNDVVDFVIRQLSSMPLVLARGVRIATAAFALAAMARNGTPFHRLASGRRRVQIAAWTRSRFGPCRDLMKLYTSLVLLVLYSRKPFPPSLEHSL